MFKKFLNLLLVFSFALTSASVLAEIPSENELESVITPVSIFVTETCPHCHDLRSFLADLSLERDDFDIKIFFISDPENEDLFVEFTTLEGLPQSVPVTLVGNRVISGFGMRETTGKQIVDILDASSGIPTLEFREFIDAGGSEKVIPVELPEPEKMLVDAPFIGVIDAATFGLPTMSFLLGFIDGFNPCAMWVLVTFLVVLVQIGDRRKMWEIAGLFILAEAVMYFVILNAWFFAFEWITQANFAGATGWLTPAVGVVAAGGGVFFLYEGIFSDGTCKVTNVQQRASISQQIKNLASKPMTWAVAGGVLVLAFSVNIIEFACSIGIPQAFTQILQLNDLNVFLSEIMISVYTFAYMLDDLFVFGLALAGASAFAATAAKYSRATNIVGGFLMLAIAAAMIFAPELLKIS